MRVVLIGDDALVRKTLAEMLANEVGPPVA
jgi:hypothetical protein